MLKIIDRYILKRYLVTFTVMILMFIPIGIIIDVSEKINRILENKVPFIEVVKYYLDFTVYFANILFPIFLFLSVVWFTSKLANNTEVTAILSSGISFTRFLRPYLIGATLVSVFALFMTIYLVPKASAGFQNFRFNYLLSNGKETVRGEQADVFRQINKDEYIFVSNFNDVSKMAFNFSIEKFKGDKLQYKLTAGRIQWNADKKNYTLYNYTKRKVGEYSDIIESGEAKDTVFNFDLEDLTPVVYIAETLPLGELNKFIEKEKERGSSNINTYLVVLYKKYSTPVSSFILTIIAVSVSSIKRRGGMGLSLTIGIFLAFTFVFFDKIFGVMAEESAMPPLIAVWIPNIVFGILAIYLLRNARR